MVVAYLKGSVDPPLRTNHIFQTNSCIRLEIVHSTERPVLKNLIPILLKFYINTKTEIQFQPMIIKLSFCTQLSNN